MNKTLVKVTTGVVLVGLLVTGGALLNDNAKAATSTTTSSSWSTSNPNSTCSKCGRKGTSCICKSQGVSYSKGKSKTSSTIKKTAQKVANIIKYLKK